MTPNRLLLAAAALAHAAVGSCLAADAEFPGLGPQGKLEAIVFEPAGELDTDTARNSPVKPMAINRFKGSSCSVSISCNPTLLTAAVVNTALHRLALREATLLSISLKKL